MIWRLTRNSRSSSAHFFPRDSKINERFWTKWVPLWIHWLNYLRMVWWYEALSTEGFSLADWISLLQNPLMWMMGHTSAGKEGSTEDVKGRGVAISLWAGIIRSVVACLFGGAWAALPLSFLFDSPLSFGWYSSEEWYLWIFVFWNTPASFWMKLPWNLFLRYRIHWIN